MNKYLLTLILSASVLTQVTIAMPELPKQQPGTAISSKPAPDVKKHRNEFSKRLNLTEEQKQQAKELRIASQEKMKPLMDKLIQKQNERNSLESRDGNDKEIQILNDEIKNIRQELHRIILQNERDFMEILTPEQKNEFNKMRNERKQLFQQKRMMKKIPNQNNN